MRFEGTGGEKSGGEYFQWCFVSHNIQVRKSLVEKSLVVKNLKS